MAYISLSSTCIFPAERHIHENWIHSRDTNFLYKHVLARGARLALAPASVIIHALDIIIGLGAGAATTATLGMHRKTAHFASDHLYSSNGLISNPYKNLLKAINPTATVTPQGAGLLTPPVKTFMEDLAINFIRSDSVLVQHTFSRLTYALTGPALIITRVVDAIIGVLAAAVSFVTLGLIGRVNSTAFAGLQAAGVVDDIFACVMKTVNPWAQVKF